MYIILPILGFFLLGWLTLVIDSFADGIAPYIIAGLLGSLIVLTSGIMNNQKTILKKLDGLKKPDEKNEDKK